MNYNEWIERWLEQYVKPTSKQRTYERYLELSRLHIIPALGGYDIEELSADKMQKFVSQLLESGNIKTSKGLASNTVCAIINILQNSLKAAFVGGHASNYAADKIKRPKKEERRIECFSLKEQRCIESEIKCEGRPKLFGIVICFYTGIRIGELLALEWSDVDLKDGLLTISKSCHDGKDEYGHYIKIVETPKTDSSKRSIPIPQQIVPLLKKLYKTRDSQYVVSENAHGISVRSYQRSFDLLLKRLKIEHRGFHSIRHTFATRALECGMDIKTLAEVLGHKSPMVTLNRYVHSRLEHKKEMMNRLGKF